MSVPASSPFKDSIGGSQHDFGSNTSVHDSSYMRALARGDVEALIKNCTILSVDDFIKEMMSSMPKPKPITVADDLFKDVPYNKGSAHVLEKSMYQPLQLGFDTISKELSTKLGTERLRCLQTYTKMNPIAVEQGFDVRIAPDLYLTFYEDKIDQLFAKKDNKRMSLNSWKESLFHYPGLFIEVKRSAGANFPWDVKDKATHDAALSTEAKDLLEQIHRYVAYAQYPAYPYRFIYCITVTGEYMRFWKWSATGARVSDSIKYVEHSKPVVDFLQALHLGGDYAIGVNVGERLLFESYDHQGITDKDFEGRVAQMAKEYNDNAEPAWKDWLVAAQSSGMWKLGANLKLKDQYIVMQYPIYATIGIFGRGTRCYLAIKQQDFKDGKLNFKTFQTFKMSWQFIIRGREDDFYAVANTKDGAVQPIPNLATIIGSDILLNSQQSAAVFVEQVGGDPAKLPSGSPSGATTSHDDSHFYHRELRWLLLGTVGRRLTTAKTVGEIVLPLQQCLAAHITMRNRDVLHRDISANNILINVVDKNGLLVDLDSAKYLGDAPSTAPSKRLKASDEKRKDARPAITGTMVFSAIALAHSPEPRSWHDFESFFWLLVWCTIRHVNNVTLVWANGQLLLNSPENRQRALDQIFRYEAARVEEAREQGAQAKLEFLENCAVSCANSQLEMLVNELRVLFKEHYALIRPLQAATDAICRSYKLAKQEIPGTIGQNLFSLASSGDITKEMNIIKKEAAKIPNKQPYAVKEVAAAVKRATAAASDPMPPFPSYNIITEIFAAFDFGKASALETSKFTPKQREDDDVFKSMF